MDEINYVDELTPKQKIGWNNLISTTRRKYPFIKNVIIDEPISTWSTLLSINIVFDLEEMISFYNVEQPRRYKEVPYLYKAQLDPRPFLFTFVDEQYQDQFKNEFNKDLVSYMQMAYRSLPPEFRVNMDEDAYLSRHSTKELSITNFIPIFDVKKYYDVDREGEIYI